jgi:hypothetical protein
MVRLTTASQALHFSSVSIATDQLQLQLSSTISATSAICMVVFVT